ncbi:MAG: bifunctional heptose 7-phosphate kinase/heptose 1-phosphate adenyltransferase [Phycisphaerae bacterium]|jgi:D-beta-D-heptose 7-phosphate kinase/D-beta-D-heptose 1-phosphate adenosyltransferase
MDNLIEQVKKFGSPRVVLVGDFMLDRYVYGEAERLSPEAPVPVLNIVRTETHAGGAGNVALAMAALGAKVSCVGLTGQDPMAEELKGMLVAAGARTTGMMKLNTYPTTVKTRYIGLAHRHPQQLLRVDAEAGADSVPENIRATLRAAVRSELGGCKMLAIEDYNKGVLNDQNTPQIIEDAQKSSCAVVVDPARIPDYRRYRGATVIVPNRPEAELASGIAITDEASLERAARQVLIAAEAQAVVIKLDKEGSYLFGKDGKGRRMPTRARSVYDVTGAGDEVLAMLAVALAEGCQLDTAVALANVAGGLEVERFGAVPIPREDVLAELLHMAGLRGGKVLSRRQLADELARRRGAGDTIVFTNGCFDLLHMGHLRYLRQARELGSCLVVAINSDASVARLKGPSRPIIGQDERAEMLGSLECVDYVTVFDEDTPEPLLKLLKPNILAKGGSTGVIVGQEIVEGYGGQVVKLDLVSGLSTTEIINRIMTTNNGGAAT